MKTKRFGPFGHRPFAVYWAGGFFSNVGTWLQAVTGSVFVYDHTGSAFAVGILNFATFLPVLLFSVAGGVLSDRFDRRAIVVVTHVGSFAISLGLAILIATGGATEVHVILLAFVLQTSGTIAKPSLTAMLPALIPRAELTEAVGLNTLQFVGAQLVGPVLATIILATSGYAWAFGINAATYLGPIVAMGYLARHGLAGRAGSAERAALRSAEGVRSYIGSHRWIGSLLLGVISTSAILEVIRTIAPVLVTERLGAPSSVTGLIVAAQSVGSICGLVAFVPLRRRDLSRSIAIIGLLLQAAGVLTVSLATAIPAAALGVAAIGMGFSLCFPVITGVLQTEIPDAMRGRIMSMHQMAHLGNRPFTALAAGALAAGFGVPVAALASLVLVPVGLFATRSAWRQLDALPVPDPVGAALRS